ncbi:hypothetical protein BH09PSE1_BH09PSE1_16070 [soil metagenome]
MTAAFNLPVLLDPGPGVDGLAMVAGMAPLIFVFAFIIWTFGLVVVGGPGWASLHGRGMTRPGHALALGLCGPFLIALLWNLMLTGATTGLSQGDHVLIENGHRTFDGWLSLLAGCGLLSGLGGFVALVIWRIAYRTER